MNPLKDKRAVYIRKMIYVIFFLVMLYISWRVPYCHDEWMWGLDERIQLLKEGFRDYNGRYLGNILALIITRSNLAKAFVIAFGTTVLLYIINAGLKDEKNGYPKAEAQIFFVLVSIALLLGLPKEIFAQSYGWPAAFVNFVPPVITFLIYFNWTEPLYRAEKVRYTTFQNISVIFLAFAGQLFSEHNTVFAVLYGGWVLLYAWIKTRRLYACHVGYFAGCVAGALVMFSNGAYRNAAADTDGYKKIAFSVRSMIEQYARNISDSLFLNNWLLNLLLALLIILLIIRKGKQKPLGFAVTAVLSGYAVYGVWHKIYPSWTFVANETANLYIRTGASLLYFIAVIVGLYICMEEEKYAVIILYLSAAAVAVPLLVANPIGPRCFYVSYVLMSVAAIKCMRRLLMGVKRETLYYLGVMAASLVLVLFFIYIRMFHAVGAVNQARADIISSSVRDNADEIVLPHLPYSDYFWITEPPNEIWEERFKRFYHIPPETVLRFEEM